MHYRGSKKGKGLETGANGLLFFKINSLYWNDFRFTEKLQKEKVKRVSIYPSQCCLMSTSYIIIVYLFKLRN
jgi:hypothetical protein